MERTGKYLERKPVGNGIEDYIRNKDWHNKAAGCTINVVVEVGAIEWEMGMGFCVII